MRIDPDIAALQRDRAPQQQATAKMVAACDEWRRMEGTGPVVDDLGRYGDGAPLLHCPALFAAFTDEETAPRLAAGLVRAVCTGLAQAPLGHPPLRHGHDRGRSTLLLARRNRALLVLHA